MRIGPAANVARLNVDEIVTALWSFANAQGLLTDDINERTPAAGVTIDGVRLANIAIDLVGLASPANRVLGSDVFGDLDERFRLHAGGIMQWGDGAGARDTQLERDAANELGTPDDFNVGGVLDLAGDIELSERNITLAAGATDDLGTAAVTVQRLDTAAGVANITGAAGGRAGRVVIFLNLGPNAVTLNNGDLGSTAANRFLNSNTIDKVLGQQEAVTYWYDITSLRWRMFTLANT